MLIVKQNFLIRLLILGMYLKITKFCTLSFLQITLDRINAFIIASKTTTANYKGSAS